MLGLLKEAIIMKKPTANPTPVLYSNLESEGKGSSALLSSKTSIPVYGAVPGQESVKLNTQTQP